MCKHLVTKGKKELVSLPEMLWNHLLGQAIRLPLFEGAAIQNGKRNKGRIAQRVGLIPATGVYFRGSF
jgi:hypothetical protein